MTAGVPRSPPWPCPRCACLAQQLWEQEQKGDLTLPADRPLRTETLEEAEQLLAHVTPL